MVNTDLDFQKFKRNSLSSDDIIVSPDDIDNKILDVLKTATSKRISLSIDGIAYVLDLSQSNFDRLNRRLQSLRKYGFIKKACERKTSFWTLNEKSGDNP